MRYCPPVFYGTVRLGARVLRGAVGTADFITAKTTADLLGSRTCIAHRSSLYYRVEKFVGMVEKRIKNIFVLYPWFFMLCFLYGSFVYNFLNSNSLHVMFF